MDSVFTGVIDILEKRWWQGSDFASTLSLICISEFVAGDELTGWREFLRSQRGWAQDGEKTSVNLNTNRFRNFRGLYLWRLQVICVNIQLTLCDGNSIIKYWHHWYAGPTKNGAPNAWYSANWILIIKGRTRRSENGSLFAIRGFMNPSEVSNQEHWEASGERARIMNKTHSTKISLQLKGIIWIQDQQKMANFCGGPKSARGQN